MKKYKFYSLKNILEKHAPYNIIFGERSNGKTYAVLKYGMEECWKTGSQMAIVRRWQEDFTGKRGQVMFNALVENKEVEKITGGEWTNIYYFASKWYFCRFDERGERETSPEPFCYGFAISAQEHDKSTSYPKVTNILFDEMITRNVYLPDEFVLCMNLFSTIIRQRTNVKIFMLGNTVNKYCPYFGEMGLKHVREMEPGDIDLYRYGDSELTVAVEYCKPNKEGKESDFYFSFDNPKLSMITGGAWEIDIYPHLPFHYQPKDILFIYYIEWLDDVLQCEIIQKENTMFTYIHRKTGGIKKPDEDIVFTTRNDPRPNYSRKITKPRTDLQRRIADFFLKEKVFYQDNETGEIVRNYLIWCGQSV